MFTADAVPCGARCVVFAPQRTRMPAAVYRTRDDREWSFAFPFRPIPVFKSHSLSPRHFHCVIPIPTHAQENADSRAIKTVPQKTGHQSLNNKNSKNTIHNTLKIRQKFHLSKHYVS